MRLPGSDETIARLRSIPGARVGRGATGDEIADAERALGVRLPEGYRAFVEGAGWAVAGDLTLFGLGDDVPEDLDLRRVSATASRSGKAVVVARDGGDLLCLDATYEGPYDSPVYRCTPDGGFGDDDYVAHDYPSWLWMRLAQRDG